MLTYTNKLSKKITPFFQKFSKSSLKTNNSQKNSKKIPPCPLNLPKNTENCIKIKKNRQIICILGKKVVPLRPILKKVMIMHEFDYSIKPSQLLTPEVVRLLGILREHKGQQDLYIEAKPDVLTQLLEIAKIQSTGASNRIEGIYTSDERLTELVKEKATPRNRSEEEIAGYREVLSIIHENYEYITPRVNTLLQLHKTLYSYAGSSVGGQFKNTDNIIAETSADGKQRVRFQPVPAFLTPDAVEQLCTAYMNAIEEGKHDPLLLTIQFVLDFLCVHPFNDGNGRMSRLLTLLLLYRAGFIVGKYISIEMLIEKNKEQYYETLRESSEGWHDSENNYLPFVRYILGILIKAYDEFEQRVAHLAYRKQPKSERIRELAKRQLGKFTKRTIIDAAPDISEAAIELELSKMLSDGLIQKIGAGRGTGYVFI